MARYSASGEEERFNQIINSALLCYGLAVILVLAATGICAAEFNSIFSVQPAMRTTGKVLLVLAGGGVAAGLPLIVFGAILEGLQRFYALNTAVVASVLVRAALVIIALERGGGVVAVTAITVAVAVLGCLPYVPLVLRSTPLRLGPRYVNRKALRDVVSFSFKVFVISICDKFRFGIDTVIIGTMLSAAEVTYFAIASKLTSYSRELVEDLARVLTPMATQFDTRGEPERLRQVLVLGNRASAVVALPICAVLVVLGKQVIAAWVGQRYIATSYTVLVTLIAARTVYVSQSASTRLAYGMNRHRPLAWAFGIEGAATVALSILLARPWGIEGVAVGTAIPLLATSLFFLPVFACRLVKLPLARFLREAYAVPLALCAPLIATLLALRRALPGASLLNLGIELCAGGAVYGAAFGWWFATRDSLGIALWSRISKRVKGASA